MGYPFQSVETYREFPKYYPLPNLELQYIYRRTSTHRLSFSIEGSLHFFSRLALKSLIPFLQLTLQVPSHIQPTRLAVQDVDIGHEN